MSEWKPGDVAIAKYSHDDEPKIYMRVRNKYSGADERWESAEGSHSLAFRSADWWHLLAVIDPEDREQVERLINTYFDTYWASPGVLSSARGEGPARPIHIDAMAATLRKLTSPSKPDEPIGLGAVVKDRDGHAWVRTHATGYPWHSALNPSDLNATAARKWADIDAVEVFTEGVTS